MSGRGRGRPRTASSVDDGRSPRNQIVAVASALFEERGVETVTMQAIAEAAGLRQSSIYYWFRSKSDIISSLLEQVNRLPLEIVERELRADGAVVDRLVRVVREDVLALCAFPFDINVIHRIALRDEDGFASYHRARARLQSSVAALIAEGVTNGELDPVDVDLAAATLLANDEATQNWHRYGPKRWSDEQVADHVAATSVRGLLSSAVSGPSVEPPDA